MAGHARPRLLRWRPPDAGRQKFGTFRGTPSGCSGSRRNLKRDVPVTSPAQVDAAILSAVKDLPIEATYLQQVVTTLADIGSSPIGFRTTGTPEDVAVA